MAESQKLQRGKAYRAEGGGWAMMTGEYRAPKKGEYFLSGAIIVAYLAKNDLSQKYWIARKV